MSGYTLEGLRGVPGNGRCISRVSWASRDQKCSFQPWEPKAFSKHSATCAGTLGRKERSSHCCALRHCSSCLSSPPVGLLGEMGERMAVNSVLTRSKSHQAPTEQQLLAFFITQTAEGSSPMPGSSSPMPGSTSPAMSRPRCQGQPPAPGSTVQLAQPCHKSTTLQGAAFQSQLGVTAAQNAEQKGSASQRSPPSSRVSEGCGGQEQPMGMHGAAPPLPHSRTRGQGHSRTARRSCAHPQHR